MWKTKHCCTSDMSSSGKPRKTPRHLRSRVRGEHASNAFAAPSVNLGVLLEDEPVSDCSESARIQARPDRNTDEQGRQALDSWMARCFVTWHVDPTPWVTGAVIEFQLPLNIETTHPFAAVTHPRKAVQHVWNRQFKQRSQNLTANRESRNGGVRLHPMRLPDRFQASGCVGGPSASLCCLGMARWDQSHKGTPDVVVYTVDMWILLFVACQSNPPDPVSEVQKGRFDCSPTTSLGYGWLSRADGDGIDRMTQIDLLNDSTWWVCKKTSSKKITSS